MLGTYFTGMYFSATSNACWHARKITAGEPVLAVPDTQQTREIIEAALAGTAPGKWGAYKATYRQLAKIVIDQADQVWTGLRAAALSNTGTDLG